MVDLDGRHLLITGAEGALGAAVADRAIDLGARLTLVDLKTPRGSAEANCLALNLLDADAVSSALQEAGPFDGVLHIAGGFDMGPSVADMSAEALNAMIALNVTTLHNLVRAVVPQMEDRPGSAIVTVGAYNALSGKPNMGAYCAAKSMVMRLSESMAAELGPKGIRVNCVLPGIIDTPANRASMPDADRSGWTSPSAVADAMLFLCSPQARAINGALVPVNNGVED
ncbi:MAG TPA: SDR family oxidoreductase [Pedomonas sp.]|uniref:SDR family oxidoreductase n=1 Tax=Pedomonas sp. TaxID=2976421 RepID=UPI002F42E651